MTLPVVEIHYRRPPDRVQIFRQMVLEETLDHVVTYVEATDLPRPILAAGGLPILEPGSPVVWFTFPNAWFDIGRFHLASGLFTGLYVNILTPVRMNSGRWETTDLFLDLWLDRAGDVTLRDEDELAAAVEAGWLDAGMAATARSTAGALMSQIAKGGWPPPIVHEWPLERARGTKNGARSRAPREV